MNKPKQTKPTPSAGGQKYIIPSTQTHLQAECAADNTRDGKADNGTGLADTIYPDILCERHVDI